MITSNKTETDSIILTIGINDRPTNVITESFLATFETMVDEITKDHETKGIILTSSRKDFMAGADLEMITHLNDAKQCYKLTRRVQNILRRMEVWGKPVVAAINGNALGGGFEICLGCHYRIAIDNNRIKLGLPEVKLGLIPGGGGTQKLPRIMGIQASLPFLLEGKTVNPKKALEIGIIDELAIDAKSMMKKAQAFIDAHQEIKQPWDEKHYKIPGGEVQSPKGYQVFPAATAMLMEKTCGNYPAPLNILKSVYEGLQVPMDQGLAIEARYFTELVMDKRSKHMIKTLFYGINQCNKGIERPKSVPAREIRKVGVLGAGMMGSGIAYVTAKADIPVVLKDVSMEVAEKGKSYSTRLLVKAVERERTSFEEKERILSLIETTDDPGKMKDCDLVIEAVIEDRKLKAKVTKESEDVMPSDAIFASNTSTLPITGLATESQRPHQFIGLHFFSPVDKMPLLEIIMGENTGDEALALCLDYAKKIKKTPIVVNDGRGFYTSRVFTTYISEGIACLNEGINPALIEHSGKASGMPVGPLAVADEVSLDLIYHILKQTVDDLGEGAVESNTYLTSNLFVNKLKRLGRKSGGGFYEYPDQGRKYLWPGLKEHFSLKDEQPSPDEIKKRLLTIQALETFRCLNEKVLRSGRDADVGSILGWGFPAYTGGTLSYIDLIGIDRFIEDCEFFEQKHGERFKVSDALKEMAKDQDASFYQ